MLPHMPRIRAKKASYPRANFPNRYIYTYGAERRAPSAPLPPVEMLLPASVDRFLRFHTCPAYEQKKRAIPGRIFLIACIPMVPSAERPSPHCIRA